MLAAHSSPLDDLQGSHVMRSVVKGTHPPVLPLHDGAKSAHLVAVASASKLVQRSSVTSTD